MCRHRAPEHYHHYQAELAQPLKTLVDEGVLWPWGKWMWMAGVLFCLFLALTSEAAWALNLP